MTTPPEHYDVCIDDSIEPFCFPTLDGSSLTSPDLGWGQVVVLLWHVNRTPEGFSDGVAGLVRFAKSRGSELVVVAFGVTSTDAPVLASLLGVDVMCALGDSTSPFLHTSSRKDSVTADSAPKGASILLLDQGYVRACLPWSQRGQVEDVARDVLVRIG